MQEQKKIVFQKLQNYEVSIIRPVTPEGQSTGQSKIGLSLLPSTPQPQVLVDSLLMERWSLTRSQAKEMANHLLEYVENLQS